MLRAISFTLAIAVTAPWMATADAQQSSTVPAWAYGFDTPTPPSANVNNRPPVVQRDNVTLYSVPGSKQRLTEAQAQARYAPGDWFPEDHLPMPDFVAHGRESAQPPIYACAFCHMPNGKGRPENANITGLPKAYFVQQMIDFRDNLRKTSEPRKTNTSLMHEFAKAMTDAEIDIAADYFAATPNGPWIKVVEATNVPKARAVGGIFFVKEGAESGSEPLGNRILEVAVEAEQTEKWRNPRSGFIAYVPPGSLSKGQRLVESGDNARVTACGACHGMDLKGIGPIPPLAGRAASYIVRQLFDMRNGNRAGAWSGLMAPVVSKMTDDDLINAAAYAASLAP